MLNWKESRFGPEKGGKVWVLEEMLPKFYKKLEILFRWLFKTKLDSKVIWFVFELLRKWVCFKFDSFRKGWIMFWIGTIDGQNGRCDNEG